jgi:hypothetical protein
VSGNGCYHNHYSIRSRWRLCRAGSGNSGQAVGLAGGVVVVVLVVGVDVGVVVVVGVVVGVGVVVVVGVVVGVGELCPVVG